MSCVHCEPFSCKTYDSERRRLCTMCFDMISSKTSSESATRIISGSKFWLPSPMQTLYLDLKTIRMFLSCVHLVFKQQRSHVVFVVAVHLTSCVREMMSASFDRSLLIMSGSTSLDGTSPSRAHSITHCAQQDSVHARSIIFLRILSSALPSPEV